MLPHLLRCQWLWVGDYTLAIGRLEAGTASTFAQLGYSQMKSNHWIRNFSDVDLSYHVFDLTKPYLSSIQ